MQCFNCTSEAEVTLLLWGSKRVPSCSYHARKRVLKELNNKKGARIVELFPKFNKASHNTAEAVKQEKAFITCPKCAGVMRIQPGFLAKGKSKKVNHLRLYLCTNEGCGNVERRLI